MILRRVHHSLRSTKLRLLVALVAVATAVSGCGFTGLYGAPLPGGADLGSHPFTVTVYFTNVLDLVPQSMVKVNDVEVGRVEKVALSKTGDPSGDPKLNGWTAKVELKVNGDVHLPANARAEVRMTSLLGEKYVALEQPIDAAVSRPLVSGAIIPLTHTGSAPEVEDVLGALSLLLNGGGLQQIHVITTELNKALQGNESAVRDLLGQLNTFVGTLNQQKDQIFTALDSVDRLTKTLNANTRLIQQTLDTLPQALSVLRQERTKFVTLLTSLSNLGSVATRVITATQQNLVTTLKSLAPVLDQLTASGSDLTEALKIAGTFPFPLGTTLSAVKGDYANLNAFVNLNLVDELCGLNKQLCSVLGTLPIGKTPPGSAGNGDAATNSSATSSSATTSGPSSLLEPTLLGVGG
jgi:phospholipid/cholesterol/gamma-HCH transport system substrate-binding protein